MPVDLSGLTATITALTAEATRTEGTEASAGVIIAGITAAMQKAVTDALTADAAANATSISAANDAIAAVGARFSAADDKLGAAVAANNPNPPAPAPAA